MSRILELRVSLSVGGDVYTVQIHTHLPPPPRHARQGILQGETERPRPLFSSVNVRRRLRDQSKHQSRGIRENISPRLVHSPIDPFRSLSPQLTESGTHEIDLTGAGVMTLAAVHLVRAGGLLSPPRDQGPLDTFWTSSAPDWLGGRQLSAIPCKREARYQSWFCASNHKRVSWPGEVFGCAGGCKESVGHSRPVN